MIFVCPSCGIRLEKDFKFCPNCGFDLSSPAENEEKSNGNGHKDSSESGLVICEYCGEENNSANDFCSNCGVKLPGKKGVKPIAQSAKTAPPPQKKKTQAQKQTSAKPAAVQKQPARTLSSNQIFVIIGATLGILAIILFASGVFDSAPVPPAVVNNQTAPAETGTPGVDLSLMPQINQLEEKVKANPSDQESLLQLAHLKNDARLYEQAIQSYRQYLEKTPSNADARVDMGVCYFNLKDYKTAIAEMEKALEYQPKHQIAHLNLGIVNLTAGNLESSKEWLRKAVEIDPNSDVGKRAKELLESH